jgi:hypothetical protein
MTVGGIAQPSARADLIYEVVDYPTLENGYTVTGTITTNGATGTSLPASDITSWDITISKGSTTIFTLTPMESANASAHFDATTTAITVADEITFSTSSGTGIDWFNTIGAIVYQGALNNTLIWDSDLPSLDSPIATIPEPSTAIVAVFGAATFAAYGWSRRRRDQREGKRDISDIRGAKADDMSDVPFSVPGARGYIP